MKQELGRLDTAPTQARSQFAAVEQDVEDLSTELQILRATPAGLIEHEAAFKTFLPSADSFDLQGSRLTILNATGQAVLVLASIQQRRDAGLCPQAGWRGSAPG